MEQALLASNLVLWIVVVAMAAVIAGLVRQIGVLHERVAPAGALALPGGPEVGEPSPVFSLRDLLGGGELAVGGSAADGRSTLLFFLAPHCPVCSALLPVLESVRRSEQRWLRVVLASDGEPAAQRAFAAEKGLESFPYVLSRDLGLAFRVGKLPYAVLIDEGGVVRAKGLVNSREHLESLFEARERGVASIQEYVRRDRSREAVGA